MKNWVIALLTTQLAAGCVATSTELAAVKTEFSYDQEQARLERQRLENRLAAVESRLVRLQKTNVRSTNSDNANKDGLAQKVLRLEADLKKFEKSSALAVQMGLISSVHADTNDQGIAGIRAELEKLSAELQALEQRLLASDKQLETGLVQLREISAKLK